MKQTTIILLIGIFICLTTYAYAQDSESATLTDDQKRFDLDNNGVLSPDEDQLMLQVTSLEAFTDEKLSSEEIKKIANIGANRRDGGPPGFGGFPPPGFDRGGQPQGANRGGRGGPRAPEKIVTRFDTNKDGKLTGEERQTALESRGRLYNPEQRAGTPSGNIQDDVKASLIAKPQNSPEFYDAGTLRTLYLRFPDEDWYAQLNAFYRTDVEVPAELVVDGKVYSEIGVRFRGTSSYFTVESEKKSFNLAIDYGDDSQRLFGYKTLNLLNGHVDTSFVREVLYNRIAREYMPAMKTNFVKLVINGENWGIYINLQQYNKDFLAEWFGTRDGIRWKIGPGGGALTYLGQEISQYERTYQLKTANVENPWEKLIALTELLDSKTSDEELVANLPKQFNIDQALWQLAVSNVFMDDDGYIHKGGDYSIYQDVNDRFHLISHDNNESFRFGRAGRGGPGGRGPGGWSWGELTSGMVSPTTHSENEMRPVISRLLNVPKWKARYIAHGRTVVDEWLDWEVLEPIINEYHELIDTEVQKDDKKLYRYEDFKGSADGQAGRRSSSLKQFVTQRREFLLKHSELNKPVPKIVSVTTPKNPLPNQPIEITTEIEKAVEPDSVLLYYATDRYRLFKDIEMEKHGYKYKGTIPAFPAGTNVYYYVEANSVKTHGTTVFSPERAEFGALNYNVNAKRVKNPTVVINELMPANTNSIVDPQGEYEDWLELHNTTDKPVLLSGMYLTDKTDNPKKWKFPENTTIPPKGYLIVWLDEDGKAKDGLHANFKLSRNGETVMLVDRDARENKILDATTYGKCENDSAIGRFPNASGKFQLVQMTPGEKNKLQ